MTSDEEFLSAQFLRWELRGRGWQVFEEPVALEPPFRAFEGHFLPHRPQAEVDQEGRLGSVVGNLLWKLRKAYSPTEEEIVAAGPTAEEDEEPELELWRREDVVEFQLSLPRERRFSRERMESLLLMVGACKDPIAFEILATAREIVVQLAASAADADLVRQQLEAHYPEMVLAEQEDVLLGEWAKAADGWVAAEFGLAKEFMLALATPRVDILQGVLAAMGTLIEGELLLYQVLFQAVQRPWASSALAAVSDGAGGPFFTNRPELLAEARIKLQRPLYATTLKLAAVAESSDRALRLLAPAVTALSALERPGGNRLVPLADDREEAAPLEDDLLNRESHRLGMLINLDELQALVHFPDETVLAPRLRMDSGLTRAFPGATADGGLFLGYNDHAGRQVPVALTLEQRVRHLHLVGGSGTGKSTLLYNLIESDIRSGQGLTVIDPHGDLIDKILGNIPPERFGDVMVIDPADEGYSVGFNVLLAHTDFEKTLLASDLVSIFQRLSTSWGDQMGSVLNYAILAFLESSEGGTLVDLKKFLLDEEFRNRFLKSVNDTEVIYYWKKGFPQLGGGKSIGPVLTRLGLFLAPKPIRYMVSQRKNQLNFSELMDAGKIILARLPQGAMGRENAFLLGSLMVSKLHQAAMARQRIPEDQRRLHTLYVDEFQNFCTPSMAEILTSTRKYRVSLVLAHQSLDQIKRHDEVGAAVLANAGTRVVFRVSDSDARELERGFAHFDAQGLQSLGRGQAIVRIERSDVDFNLSVPLLPTADLAQAALSRDSVIEASRLRYATKRADIEAELGPSLIDEDLDAATGKGSKKSRLKAEKTTAKPEPPDGAAASAETGPAPAQRPEVPSDGETPGSAKASTHESFHVPPPLPKAAITPELKELDDQGSTALPAPVVDLPPLPTTAQPQAAPKPVSSVPPPAAAYAPTSIQESAEGAGRGGVEHQAAQMELKKVAEGLGFRAVIESQVAGTLQAADLYLEREGEAIACEISVSNTVEAELRNVNKHLRAQVPMVAVVCLDPHKLAKLKTALTNSLPPAHLPRVLFFLKHEFVDFLQTRVVKEPETGAAKGKSKKAKGLKVTVTMVEKTPEETKLIEDQIAASLAASLEKKRRKRKKKE